MRPGERKKTRPARPGRGKPERYIQPSLLRALLDHDAYGYELIKIIPEYGFVMDDVPPGMIYRHLRQMEDEGLLDSSWQTEDSGPAKRIYRITAQGREALAAWVRHMEAMSDRLTRFIEGYARSGPNDTNAAD